MDPCACGTTLNAQHHSCAFKHCIIIAACTISVLLVASQTAKALATFSTPAPMCGISPSGGRDLPKVTGPDGARPVWFSLGFVKKALEMDEEMDEAARAVYARMTPAERLGDIRACKSCGLRSFGPDSVFGNDGVLVPVQGGWLHRGCFDHVSDERRRSLR